MSKRTTGALPQEEEEEGPRRGEDRGQSWCLAFVSDGLLQKLAAGRGKETHREMEWVVR